MVICLEYARITFDWLASRKPTTFQNYRVSNQKIVSKNPIKLVLQSWSQNSINPKSIQSSHHPLHPTTIISLGFSLNNQSPPSLACTLSPWLSLCRWFPFLSFSHSESPSPCSPSLKKFASSCLSSDSCTFQESEMPHLLSPPPSWGGLTQSNLSSFSSRLGKICFFKNILDVFYLQTSSK